jgi:hypothetical protein
VFLGELNSSSGSLLLLSSFIRVEKSSCWDLPSSGKSKTGDGREENSQDGHCDEGKISLQIDLHLVWKKTRCVHIRWFTSCSAELCWGKGKKLEAWPFHIHNHG